MAAATVIAIYILNHFTCFVSAAAEVSSFFIVKNKTAYEHLATGLPVQQILDEIIPKLIKLYKGHVVQIVQFETDLSCINLAVLFDDSYTKEMHQAKIGKIHKAINSINDKYGPDTLTVINCNYRDVQDSNKNSSYIYKARIDPVLNNFVHVVWCRAISRSVNFFILFPFFIDTVIIREKLS